jgi:hypothetical protein
MKPRGNQRGFCLFLGANWGGVESKYAGHTPPGTVSDLVRRNTFNQGELSYIWRSVKYIWVKLPPTMKEWVENNQPMSKS